MSHWPLLPPPRAPGETAPRDEPLEAAFAAVAFVAGLLLTLRLLAASTAAPGSVALVVAKFGGFTAVELLALVLAATLALPLLQAAASMRVAWAEMSLRLYDKGVHLGVVLSATAAVATLALRDAADAPFLWFAGQTAVFWACHRIRLALANNTAAGGRR